MWISCISVSSLFIQSTVNEYKDSDPITTVTFIDYKAKPDPVIVKICNSVFLDMEKVLNYNGANISYESYEFLYEAALGNFMFDDSKWVLSTSVNDIFFLSARTIDAFKLDIGKFLGTCYVVGTYKDCIQDFKWHLDIETSCYQAEVDLGGYGRNRALKLGFYFSPDITLGKYIAQLGAYVTFFHPTDYIPYSGGFFLEPKDFVVVSATTEHKVQKTSLKKAKCISTEGPQWYNFTGAPFQVSYNPEYCSNLCFAEAYYRQCNCSPFYGMNQTNSECLEIEEVRVCLKRLGAFPEIVEAGSQSCLSNCLSKCSQTYLEKSIFKERNKYTKYKMLTGLNDLSTLYEYESEILSTMKYRIGSSTNPLEEADKVNQGIAHVTFYLENNQQEVVVEVLPFMTFSTLISNIGGLMGLWLGLSAISVMQVLEKCISKLLVARHTVRLTSKQTTARKN